MLFSTNSAIALSGLLCDSAMIRIAFQSSPIRSFPVSLFLTFISRFDPRSILVETEITWPISSDAAWRRIEAAN
jgi:hypothetical protein